jgi:hypothetical protein
VRILVYLSQDIIHQRYFIFYGFQQVVNLLTSCVAVSLSRQPLFHWSNILNVIIVKTEGAEAYRLIVSQQGNRVERLVELRIPISSRPPQGRTQPPIQWVPRASAVRA